MNKQLIEQIITATTNEPCPEIIFENPLLDKNVAKALSKTLVHIISSTEPNSQVNSNLRLSILENLKKLCQLEPENHIKIDDNFTYSLVDTYERQIASTSNDDIGKILDEHLIRSMKDMDINSSHTKSLSPEVLQALINLKEHRGDLNILYKDIIHWDTMDKRIVHILKQLWIKSNYMVDEISIKLKPEIEITFLEICHKLLNYSDCNIPELFVSNNDLKNIVTKCSVSATCFQICCSILNCLFVMTNFTNSMQIFIKTFIENVKVVCSHLTISVLYPMRLSHIALLLDIDIQELPKRIQTEYSEDAIRYMHELKTKSETDFLMLLSHFPQWFDIIPQ